jgi:predicted RNA polymerase sigma factor
VNEDVVRVLAPRVLAILVRRGGDFAAAEEAVQDALLEAHRAWGDAPPADPKGWLLTVAGRKLIDSRRSEAARHRREDELSHEPGPGPAEQADDTLLLLFLCCHPALSPASAIALTLRAVGGLTTKEIEELAPRLGDHHRLDAVRARLHERAGHRDLAAGHYDRAAARARNTAERDYLARQAARLRRG